MSKPELPHIYIYIYVIPIMVTQLKFLNSNPVMRGSAQTKQAPSIRSLYEPLDSSNRFGCC